MSFLYVNEQGAVIGLEGGYYVVRQKDGGNERFPKKRWNRSQSLVMCV